MIVIYLLWCLQQSSYYLFVQQLSSSSCIATAILANAAGSSQLHLLVDTADSYVKECKWSDMYKSAHEATGLAMGLLLSPNTMVLEKEKREQIELDGKDAHFFLAFSLYNTDGIDRILPDGTTECARPEAAIKMGFSMLMALDCWHGNALYQKMYSRIFEGTAENPKMTLYKIFNYGKCTSEDEVNTCYKNVIRFYHQGRISAHRLCDFHMRATYIQPPVFF